MGIPSDGWALACTIFEICAGFSLFEAFLEGDDEILKEIVTALGSLPEPWWSVRESSPVVRRAKDPGTPTGSCLWRRRLSSRN